MQLEVLAKNLDTLGEGPAWNSKNQKLYWVDIKGKRYHRMDVKTKQIETFDSIGMISSIVPTDTDSMAATIEHGFYLIDSEGHHTLIASVGTESDGARFNDGKADLFGNYIAGTMDLNENRPIGSLYNLHGRTVSSLLQGLTISNGMAWDIRREIFYHIDSYKRRIDSYLYNGSMNLDKIGVVVDFKGLLGNPDGMTIDEDGNIWVAHWGGGRITVFNPENGKKIEEILFPATNITSCTFAGNDLTDLYVTSASSSPNPDLGGSLFVLHTGIKGSPTYQYHVG